MQTARVSSFRSQTRANRISHIALGFGTSPEQAMQTRASFAARRASTGARREYERGLACLPSIVCSASSQLSATIQHGGDGLERRWKTKPIAARWSPRPRFPGVVVQTPMSRRSAVITPSGRAIFITSATAFLAMGDQRERQSRPRLSFQGATEARR